MHELAIARNIVEVAERHAEGRKVELVSMRVGEMRAVAPASLSFYFEVAARETSCEGAVLDISRTAGDELLIESIEVV
jgi:hydrogenase nickel incorporation protein HypA/HybF